MRTTRLLLFVPILLLISIFSGVAIRAEPWRQATPTTERTPSYLNVACDPVIDFDAIKFGTVPDRDAENRVVLMFYEDQKIRQSGMNGGTFTAEEERRMWIEDRERMIETLAYLEDGKLVKPKALYYAAFIFHHGVCSDHYQLASMLAKRSMDGGYHDAKWLYAATVDRYLLSFGKAQKYGTQFYMGDDGLLHLEPVDPTTTDEERAQYDLPPLADAERIANEAIQPHPTVTPIPRKR
jgi:hypothetical protein